MSETASAEWTSPQHLGDAVRVTRLVRDGEVGDVRIQHYETNVRVAAFLPGYVLHFPGDTPKTVPELDSWFSYPERKHGADLVFDLYVRVALDQGWQQQ